MRLENVLESPDQASSHESLRAPQHHQNVVQRRKLSSSKPRQCLKTAFVPDASAIQDLDAALKPKRFQHQHGTAEASTDRSVEPTDNVSSDKSQQVYIFLI